VFHTDYKPATILSNKIKPGCGYLYLIPHIEITHYLQQASPITIHKLYCLTKKNTSIMATPNEPSTPGTANLVLLAEAQASIQRYVTSVAEQPNPTYAFLIEHDDIVEALGIEDCESEMAYGLMRVYFGLYGEELSYKMRLFLVPVNDAGEDVIPVNSKDEQCVYDFNAPCPATCDVSSPLYYGNFNGSQHS
jgi:hypothetical protein